ncbi:hypothetical protein ACFFRR_008849 [Megaselia abdita]
MMHEKTQTKLFYRKVVLKKLGGFECVCESRPTHSQRKRFLFFFLCEKFSTYSFSSCSNSFNFSCFEIVFEMKFIPENHFLSQKTFVLALIFLEYFSEFFSLKFMFF